MFLIKTIFPEKHFSKFSAVESTDYYLTPNVQSSSVSKRCKTIQQYTTVLDFLGQKTLDWNAPMQTT